MGIGTRENVAAGVSRHSLLAADPEEQLSWEQVRACTATYGDSFYLFDDGKFRDNFARLRAAFTARYRDTRIAYSYKTNYTPVICKAGHEMGGYAEVVSEMEYDLARKLGVSGNRIIYNGPYKSFRSLREALNAGAMVNLDSMRDYTAVMMAAAETPERTFSIGLRCNFTLAQEFTSRFGFDVDGAEFRRVIEEIRASHNVKLDGLHCHFPERNLESFRLRTLRMLDIVNRVLPSPPAFLNLGGGFFGGMPESLQQALNIKAPSFDQYAEVICGLLNTAYAARNEKPVLYIEPGTALVADTLRFYTTVINIKDIKGRRIATVAGSIFNISPHSRARHLPVRVIHNPGGDSLSPTSAQYDIAGYTCIEDDYLSFGVPGPIAPGDFLEYHNVGSYSIVMKPPFILSNVPILALKDGKTFLARRAEPVGNLFESFLGLENKKNPE
jgi:diaminopimelate decarboxylase